MNNDISDLSKLAEAKSDQLNACDIVGYKDLLVVNVTINKDVQQPVSIHYDGGEGRPYKPCKNMIRLLFAAYTSNGNNFIGKTIRVYTRPDVSYGGKEVGGIRIMALSHIKEGFNFNERKNRTQILTTFIEKLDVELPAYTMEIFSEEKERIYNSINSGKATSESIIKYLSEKYLLSDKIKKEIDGLGSDEGVK